MGKIGESDHECGTQVCSQRRKRKLQEISQGSINPVAEEVGKHDGNEPAKVTAGNDGDQGTQPWFGESSGGVESVLEWFGEDAGVNGGETLKLLGVEAGFGLGIGGSGEGARGVQGGFGGETGGNNGEVVDCKGCKPWFGEDGVFGSLGGGEIQVDGSIGVAFGNGGVGLADGLIQGLFGEGDGTNEGLNVGGERFQCLSVEAEYGNVDGKGIQGLFDEIACGNGCETHLAGEGNRVQGGYFDNAGMHQGVKDGGGQVKGRRGRPKGSKNKKKIVDAEQSIEGLSDGKVKQQGLLKGSKQMQNSLSGECDKGGGGDIGRRKDASKNGKEAVAVEANETAQLKPKRGRPKGCKNKKKILAAEQSTEGLSEVGGDGKVGNEIVCTIEKQDPLKGSKKKKPGENQDSSCHIVGGNNDGGDLTVRPMILENERTNFLWDRYGVMPCEVAGGSGGGNDMDRMREKQGQQKGSKNENKNLAGGVNDNMQLKGQHRGPKGSKNQKKIIAEENQDIFGITLGGEGTDVIQKGNKNAQPKRKPGRPKGSKDKQKSEGTDIIQKGNKTNVQPKRKPGRPKGSKNKQKSEGTVIIQKGNKNDQPKKKCGRPKGSKNKQKRLSGEKIGLSSEEQTLQLRDKQCLPEVFMEENKEGSETQGVPVETVGGYCGDKGPVLVRTGLVREEDKVMPCEAVTGGCEMNSVEDKKGRGIPVEGSGANEGTNENIGLKVNHRWEEALKNKEPTITAKEESHQSGEVSNKSDGGNEGRKWKQGRPKGAKNKEKRFLGKASVRKKYKITKSSSQIGMGEGNNLKMGKSVSGKRLQRSLNMKKKVLTAGVQGSLNTKRNVLTADFGNAQRKGRGRKKKSSSQSECSVSLVSLSITMLFIMRFLKGIVILGPVNL